MDNLTHVRNLSTGAPSNATVPVLFERSWAFSDIYAATIGLLVFTFNGLTLSVFIIDSGLRRQSFSIFLIFLLTSNMLFSAIQNPLEIINFRFSHWWMGKTWCIVYYYSTNVLARGAMFTHLLISLNRIWAVTFPLSYRNAQTTKMALGFCVILWAYAHIVVLPDMVYKILSMRTPLEIYGCRARYPVRTSVQFLTNVVPLLVVTLAYPCIVYKCYRRFKGEVATANPTLPKATEPSVAPKPSRQKSGRRSGTMIGTKTTTKPITNVDQAFVVLTLLTMSAIICWTPITLTFLVGQPDFDSLHYKVAAFLFASQPVLDPILFAAALRDLRDAFRRTVALSCR